MYFPFYFSILLLCVSTAFGDTFLEKLSNIQWKCVNENCTEPISTAKARQTYIGDHKIKVSFGAGENIKVIGKSININPKDVWWLVSVGKRFGVASPTFLKENNVLVSLDDCIITKYDFGSFKTDDNKEQFEVNSSIKPSPTTEVIDGTTIPVETNEDDIVTVSDGGSNEVLENSEYINSDDSNIQRKSESIKIAFSESNSSSDNNINTAPVVSSLLPQKTVTESTSVLEPVKNLQNNDSPMIESNHKLQIVGEENSTASATSPETVLQEHIPEEHQNETTYKDFSLPINTNVVPESDSQAPTADSVNDSVKPLANDSPKSHNNVPSLEKSSLPFNMESLPLIEKNPQNFPKSDVNEGKQESLPYESSEKSATDNADNVSPIHDPAQNITSSSTDESIKEDSEIDKSAQESAEITNTPTDGTGDIKEGNKFIPSTENPEVYKENITHPPVKSEQDEHDPYFTQNIPKDPSYSSLAAHEKLNSDPVTFSASQTPSIENIGQKSVEQLFETSTEQISSLNNEPNISPQQEINEFGLADKEKISEVEVSQTESLHKDDVVLKKENSYQESENTLQNNQMPNINSQAKPESENAVDNSETHKKYPDTLSEKENTVKTGELENKYLDTKLESGNIVTNSEPHSEYPASESGDENSMHINESQDPDSERKPENNKSVENNEANTFNTLEKVQDGSILSEENVLEESASNWFSPVSSVMNSIREMFDKSEIGVDESKTVQDFTTEGPLDLQSSNNYKPADISDSHNVCEKDSFCDQPTEKYGEQNNLDARDFISRSIPSLEENISSSTLVCLVITSIAVLLFSLGYYYLENLRHDTELAARINSLSAELFFAQKELATAEEELAKANDNFQRLVSNRTSNEEIITKMKQDLEESEVEKQKLEQEIKRLEKEIESLVESSNEMHRMLAESISEDERTQSLLANIDDLKSVVSSKLEEISSLTTQLDNEKQEVELLTIALKKSEETKETLEEKLEKIVSEIDSKAMAVTNQFEDKIISLERIIEENTLERVNFEKEIYELKQKCETLSVEKELAEKTLKKVQGLSPGKALAEWLETKEVRVQLIATQKEVEKLNKELQETKDHVTNLQEREKELVSEVETLHNNYETAEKEKIEALTKLQVLSNYFKEKETQLQEELGEREAQWLQKQSEDHTIYEQMRSLREENLSYKAQNEALKREILDQEASFKIQIANEEQKAQEHWIQLRHTERRLKEAQMEAAHLRSRLTAHETNPDSLDEKHKSLEMVNGEVSMGATSPPFMLFPSPDFIPPPPLISPSRPPPLGRLSSPPLTPPPPLSPYDIFPPPPASPPPPHRVHKPQPREPPQKQKDSQSSNHSSESIEKPIRRGKR